MGASRHRMKKIGEHAGRGWNDWAVGAPSPRTDRSDECWQRRPEAGEQSNMATVTVEVPDSAFRRCDALPRSLPERCASPRRSNGIISG